MARLNILIHGGASLNTGIVSRLFEESLSNEGYWNKTGNHKKLQSYKYNTDFGENLQVFALRQSEANFLQSINAAVLVFNMNCEKSDNGTDNLKNSIYLFLNLPELERDKMIPVTILCISETPQNFANIEPIRREVLKTSNRFIHFIFGVDGEDHVRESFRRIISIAIVLSKTFDIKAFARESPEIVSTALKQKYQSNRGKEHGKNIAHLIAKTYVPWPVNKLAHDFPKEDIFELFSEVDTYSQQTPLIKAAIKSTAAVLAAFLNFYSSNIDMAVLHENKDDKFLMDTLLHTKDKRGKNLTYYVITAEKKCLWPYGTLLQFEEDFHIRNNTSQTHCENIDLQAEEQKQTKDYLKLQKCLQENIGTSAESSQVIKLMASTRNPTKASIIMRIVFCVLAVVLFQLGLYVLDIVTDSLVARDYYKKWVHINSSTGKACFEDLGEKAESASVNLRDYPNCLTNK